MELKTVFMFTCVRGTCVVEHFVGDLCSRFKPLSSLHPSVLSLSLPLSAERRNRSTVKLRSSRRFSVLRWFLCPGWDVVLFSSFWTQELLEASPAFPSALST